MRVTTWEQRMSQRAKQREDAAWRAKRAADELDRDFENECNVLTDAQTQRNEWLATAVESMTPERARETIDAPSHPCACAGGPSCCIIRYEAAKRVLEG